MAVAMEEPLLQKETNEATSEKLQEVTGHSSAFTTFLNLVTCCLGAGILSLPWTAAGASLITAGAIIALVLLLNAWTIMIIVEAAEKYQEFDLGGILSHLPGRLSTSSQAFCNILIYVTMFMCLISYLMIIVDSVSPVVEGGPLDSRAGWVIASSLVVLPLCYVDQNYLSFSSTLCIASNIFLVGFVGWLFFTDAAASTGFHDVCYLALTKGGVSMFSIIMMATVIQMNVLPIYEDLEHRSVARFRLILFAAFVFVLVLFVGFQSIALLTFGPRLPSNILEALPTDAFGYAARFGMALAVMGVYPLMVMPMVAPVLHAKSGGKAMANFVTVGIVLGAMFVTFFVNNLGVMSILNGAVSLSGFVAIFPGLIGIYLVDRRPCTMIVLIALGLIVSVVGLFLTDNYVDDLTGSCMLAAVP